MPKLVDLTKISSDADVPEFRIPQWLKPNQIVALMRGILSDTEDEDEDLVHVEEEEPKSDDPNKN